MVYNCKFRFVVTSCQHSFCHCKAYAHSKAVTQRTSGRIYARSVTAFRMTRSFAAPLTEVFQFFHRQVVTCNVEHSIHQSTTMTRRKNETVAVKPVRVCGIVVHKTIPDSIHQGSCAQGETGMTGFSLFNLVSCQKAQSIYTSLVDCLH